MTLLTYVREKNYNMCLRALESGDDPNMKNYMDQTSVYFASSQGFENTTEQILKLLLDNGGDPNVRCRSEFASDWTPLHIATYYGFNNQNNIIELLLSYKADPNIQDDFGITPLHHASRMGYDSLIKLF